MDINEIQQHPLFLWLQGNPDFVAASILVIAFVESFALIGVVVPGVLLLFIAAFLAGSGLLELPIALLMAFIGAVLGDGSSYLLGRYFRDDLRQWRPLRNSQQWIDSAERFIKNHGIKSVVAGRFIGPIRPIMPLVAGSLSMPSRSFFLVNVLSAIAWAPAYVLPGYALGAAIELPYSTAQLSAIALAILLVLGGAYYGLRRWFEKQ